MDHVCWYVPLIPVPRRQRQADLREFNASLVYKVSTRAARATQTNPVSEKGVGGATAAVISRTQNPEKAPPDCQSADK